MARHLGMVGGKKILCNGQIIGDNAAAVLLFPFEEDPDFKVNFDYRFVSNPFDATASAKSINEKTISISVGLLDSKSSYAALSNEIVIAELESLPVYFNFHIETIGQGEGHIFILLYTVTQGI